jgi:phage terminase large subunit-like protein
MTAPTKELERLVLERRLRHGGHPVLRWMASNVAVKQDAAGNLKIDKAKSTERVDGMVALAMAVGRAMVFQPQRRGISLYIPGED